jgi:hypothetical protein
MPDKHALLMEIHLPEADEPLRFMSGQSFEALRDDPTGREVYGLAHKGQDYLFFPFSFRPLDAGVLAMQLPPEYDDHCLGDNPAGARIVFGSTQGLPCFPDMPDEFQSNAGVLQLDPSGNLRVLLDKVDPARKGQGAFGAGGSEPAKPEPRKPATEACGCGHDHARPREKQADPCDCGHHHHDRRHHHHHPHHHHHHNHDAHGPVPIADTELAALLREKAEELNAILFLAARAGLITELALDDAKGDPAAPPQVRLTRIARPL